jgi:hypothetical protein
VRPASRHQPRRERARSPESTSQATPIATSVSSAARMTTKPKRSSRGPRSMLPRLTAQSKVPGVGVQKGSPLAATPTMLGSQGRKLRPPATRPSSAERAPSAALPRSIPRRSTTSAARTTRPCRPATAKPSAIVHSSPATARPSRAASRRRPARPVDRPESRRQVSHQPLTAKADSSAYMRPSRALAMARGERASTASATRPGQRPSASWAQRQPIRTSASPASAEGNRSATSESPARRSQPCISTA